jgi:hypothetical protein
MDLEVAVADRRWLSCVKTVVFSFFVHILHACVVLEMTGSSTTALLNILKHVFTAALAVIDYLATFKNTGVAEATAA